MIKQISDFENNFIKKLNALYPEKVIQLSGLDYESLELESFLKENGYDEHNFDVEAFKGYLHIDILDLNNFNIF